MSHCKDSTILKFGKYSGWTFEEVFNGDKGYVSWWLKKSESEICGAAKMFYDYLKSKTRMNKKRPRREIEDDDYDGPLFRKWKRKKIDKYEQMESMEIEISSLLVYGYLRNLNPATSGLTSKLPNVVKQVMIKYIGARCLKCNGTLYESKCDQCKQSMCTTNECDLKGWTECTGCHTKYHHKCEPHSYGQCMSTFI